MKAILTILLTLAIAYTVSGEDLVPSTPTATGGPLDPSLQREANAAIDRAVKWLVSHQAEDGHWSNGNFPALTALPLWSLVRAKADKETIEKATDYILSCVHENGSIYRIPTKERKGGGLSNYNTALCMVALHEVGWPDLNPIVLKAREFIAKTQHQGGDMYKGGMGYDPSTGRAYADLSNSYIGYEAMRVTEGAEDFRTEGDKADLDWKEAQEFLGKVQSLPEAAREDWMSDDPKERGGFIYRPDSSQAGEFTDEDGVIRFRTYGSMTYAGLLSLIYADVDRDDVRVRSAFDWAANHWTLEENPGMGAEGLFYFYNVLSKGLAAYGRDTLRPNDGEPINWRSELARKMIDLQKIEPETGEGYWINEAGRWWEADPVLVTSYALLALQIAAAQ